jgi:hypothetical protein
VSYAFNLDCHLCLSEGSLYELQTIRGEEGRAGRLQCPATERLTEFGAPDVRNVLQQEDFPTLGPQRNMQHPNYYGHGIMIPPKQMPMAAHTKVPQERWHSCLAAPKGVETQQVNPLLSNGSSGAAALAAVGKEPVPRRMSEAVKQVMSSLVESQGILVACEDICCVPLVPDTLDLAGVPGVRNSEAGYV